MDDSKCYGVLFDCSKDNVGLRHRPTFSGNYINPVMKDGFVKVLFYLFSRERTLPVFSRICVR